ncbi:hypothetical protein HGP14_15780 [Rhizobium sp. P32RR-XVIII]|uniref:hypothetical protein n=1 Tax=Rhizobium sp. P32RR-XVIII TaxID=2726738 RepID=UPI001456CE01|nr:hypothetical protein [Rhizobium sp. P32RR-XVIII]NLS04816.1 hypothetical protein [Rhizobium sp. P32RR-XVIII]
MSKVLLQKSPDIRRRIIAGMEFYLAQARKRLLVRFGASPMEDEARTYAETHFHEIGRYFDPDSHDVSDFAYAAWEAAADFHIRLIDMRRETMLSVVAGMYHTWEKQLREWLVQEFAHSFEMTLLRPKLWQRNTDELFKFLSGLGIVAHDEAFYPVIDECRLVVNVYKHAEGSSFEELKARKPCYFGAALRKGTLSPALIKAGSTDGRLLGGSEAGGNRRPDAEAALHVLWQQREQYLDGRKAEAITEESVERSYFLHRVCRFTEAWGSQGLRVRIASAPISNWR